MAKVRHPAMVVGEMEKTAQFYERSFGMQRVRQSDTSFRLSDGYISLVHIGRAKHTASINGSTNT